MEDGVGDENNGDECRKGEEEDDDDFGWGGVFLVKPYCVGHWIWFLRCEGNAFAIFILF